MSEALRFFETYEQVIYFVLGLGGVIYAARFLSAWQESRGAIYGLEQVSAQRKLNQAAISIFFLLVVGFVVFALVNFLAPAVAPEVVLPLPSGNIAEARTPTAEGEQAANPDVLATATPLPTVEIITSGCIPGEVEITSPVPGEAISGVVTVLGSADVPNFGFYKFEAARADQGLWWPIIAGRTVVKDGELVASWDTALFIPGEYVLQLVVTDNDGDALEPCRVPVLIGAPPEDE
ncbi:hypothetical protein ACFLYP_00470 [Chloroflexota bacterium]